MANLVKNSNMVFDLALLTGLEECWHDMLDHCTHNRHPPLIPSEFAVILSTKAFTSKKADLKIVTELYTSAFELRFGQADRLEYAFLDWTDDDLGRLIQVIESGALPLVEKLFLPGNQITDVGMQALATTVHSGYLPSIQTIIVGNNPGRGSLVIEAVKQQLERRESESKTEENAENQR